MSNFVVMDPKKIAIRGSIKGHLTRMRRFVDSIIPAEATVNRLEARYKTLLGLYESFDSIQTEIECDLKEEEIMDQEEERSNFEEEFYTLESIFKDWFDKLKKDSKGADAGHNVPLNATINVTEPFKLPQIALPEFDGDILEWYPFFDLFTSLIDSRENLSEINKLYYLKSALRGDASKVVGSLPLSDANYEEAKRLLIERYDNKRYIIQAHLRCLFDLSEVKSRSVASLRNIIDVSNKHLSALRGLGEQVDVWNTILIYLITSKLDHETRRQFELQNAGPETPLLKVLMDFLNRRCLALERTDPMKQRDVKSLTTVIDDKKAGKFASGASQGSKSHCPLCGKEHKLRVCFRFGAMTADKRHDEVKKLKVCYNCLGSGHHVRQCQSSPCSRCGKMHNTLLHFEGKSSDDVLNVTKPVQETGKPEAVATSACASVGLQAAVKSSVQVLLYTAIIKVRDHRNNFVECRALIDTGSQACFITECCARRLKLRPKIVDLTVNGIGLTANKINRFTDFEIHSKFGGYSLPIQALVLQNITPGLPQARISSPEQEFFDNFKLADPSYMIPGRVDVLLSNGVFTEIINGAVVRSNGSGRLKALDTKLVWIVGGPIEASMSSSFSAVSLCATHDVEFDLRRFWELEEVATGKDLDVDKCEKHFSDSFERDADGRFYIELPFSVTNCDFSYSKSFALSRFHLLEKRFVKNPSLQASYKEFIAEYLRLGLIERVPAIELDKRETYYLPHHGVVKESSLTTKLRVVYDGSAAPAGCTSINSALEIGPKLHNELLSVLLRFRTYAVALMGDIEKMFCQIKIKDTHKDFLRFFWRDSRSEELQVMRLLFLPFGLRCSPYIAIRCLIETAKSLELRYPRACALIQDSFYVDDFIAGADTLEDALSLIDELRVVCNSGGFNLRKWTSSDPNVIQRMQIAGDLKPHAFQDFDEDTKVLGLSWCPKTDSFCFKIKPSQLVRITKRSMLSELAGIFDPFGWLNPIVVKGKVLLQELWTAKVNWDEDVPEKIRNEWMKLRNGLMTVESIRIERLLVHINDRLLCCFADASVKAYGACIYMVAGGSSKLVVSKSRVAPLKAVSLARLELCAAVLAVRLLKTFAEILSIPGYDCYVWTDSSIVLAWIAKPSYHWKTFVANRVSEVHSLLPECHWNHVKSSDNPADVVSRGAEARDLVNNKLWWNGPSWLETFDPEYQRKADVFETEQDLRKLKTFECKIALIAEGLCDKISGFTRLINVQAWIKRFCTNYFLPVSDRKLGMLTLEERDYALKLLIKAVQLKHFGDTIKVLMEKKKLKSKHNLLPLNPFLDEDNIIRVGGRLGRASISYETKYPIVLPKKDRFVEALIRFEHFRNHHIGVNALIAISRQKYWIVNARTAIKSILSKCVVCARYSPRQARQLLGSLPTERTEMVRPFFNVGVDMCGPFLVRPTKRRGNSTQKCYLALFVCFGTKAVHLEMVTDLTTETFLYALRRFIARRGIPAIIFSDNGTNLVGARNCLHEWYNLIESEAFKKDFQTECVTNRIDWRFIPPRSPNFGGLWEAHIKAMKSCLYKCVQNERLTFEEFQTLVTQIESSLNSRPLCITSNSGDERDILTPGHFIMGGNLRDLPNVTEKEYQGPLTSRWFHLQQIFSHYWRRWTTEYLSTLNARSKNRQIERNVQVGDIGLLIDENLPPFKWPLCKVEEVVFGSDNLVRVIVVKMGKEKYKRGIAKFCPLPDFRAP